jgi:hypothetical protein
VQGLPAAPEGERSHGGGKPVTDPVNRRLRPRVRTLRPHELHAASTLWALQYPHELTEEQAILATPMAAKLQLLLKNDIVKAVVISMLLGLPILMWRVPLLYSRIPDAATAAKLPAHLAEDKEQHLREDARAIAFETSQRTLSVSVESFKIELSEYRKTTDKNFERLFKMMEDRRVARNNQ